MQLFKYEQVEDINFNYFLEAALIEFIYTPEVKQLRLVFRIAKLSYPEGRGEFKELVFANVEQYKRIFGVKKELRKAEREYKARDYPGIYKIEKIQFYKGSKCYGKFIIKFDKELGGFEFESDSVRLKSKIGLGKEVARSEWVYYDVDTEKEFDFYKPFL